MAGAHAVILKEAIFTDSDVRLRWIKEDGKRSPNHIDISVQDAQEQNAGTGLGSSMYRLGIKRQTCLRSDRLANSMRSIGTR